VIIFCCSLRFDGQYWWLNLLYFPIGTCLAALRFFVGLHALFVYAVLPRSTPLRRWVLCSNMLGICFSCLFAVMCILTCSPSRDDTALTRGDSPYLSLSLRLSDSIYSYHKVWTCYTASRMIQCTTFVVWTVGIFSITAVVVLKDSGSHALCILVVILAARCIDNHLPL